MAENDETTSTAAEPADKGHGHSSRASRRAAGHKGGKKSASTTGDRRGGEIRQLVDLFRNASPADKAALRAELAAGNAGRNAGGKDTPKFSTALDQVEESEAGEVIDALDRGLQQIKDDGSDDGSALEMLKEVAPDVATAAQVNSSYRRKDTAHSLRVAREYLSRKFPDAAKPDADDGGDEDEDDDGE